MSAVLPQDGRSAPGPRGSGGSGSDDVPAVLAQRLADQRAAFTAELPVSAETRIDRLDRAIALLKAHQDPICAALRSDFGHRPEPLSKFVDVVSSVVALQHARSHVRRWMRRERRPVRFPLNLLGARAWVEVQPLGVVGIVSPWNFPVNLAFGPLAGALAAGNRVMLKPSEHTPETSDLLARLLAERFDPTEVTTVVGGPEVAQAFTALPFDHLLFTGSTVVGRHVMRAAAEHLTPVTLELGGKSPAIVGASADVAMAAERITVGKLLNAGQVCLAPDYVLVARHHRDAFVAAVDAAARRLYPTVAGNPDYTTIVSDRHAERLEGYLAEARNAGADVRIVQEGAASPGDRRRPLTVLVDPPPDLSVMREEIFGPVLPIVSYGQIDEAIAWINERERPLGLYWFGSDAGERRALLDRTHAGGVTVNDVLFHFSVEDLPFGGIGASGMGAYHGEAGFRTFSHYKAVYRQAPFDVPGLIGLKPPYGKRLQRMIDWDLR